MMRERCGLDVNITLLFYKHSDGWDDAGTVRLFIRRSVCVCVCVYTHLRRVIRQESVAVGINSARIVRLERRDDEVRRSRKALEACAREIRHANPRLFVRCKSGRQQRRASRGVERGAKRCGICDEPLRFCIGDAPHLRWRQSDLYRMRGAAAGGALCGVR